MSVPVYPRDLHVDGDRPALHCLLNAVIALASDNSPDRQRLAAHWLGRAARCLRDQPQPSPSVKARLAAAEALLCDNVMPFVAPSNKRNNPARH